MAGNLQDDFDINGTPVAQSNFGELQTYQGAPLQNLVAWGVLFGPPISLDDSTPRFTGTLGGPPAQPATAFNGWLLGPLQIAKAMLAQTAAFRDWTNTGNVTAALARIFLFGADEDETLPDAIVDVARRESTTAGGGGGQAFDEHGGVTIQFDPALPDDADLFWAENVEAFAVMIEAVITQLENLGEVTVSHEGTQITFPTISSIELLDGPVVFDPDKNNKQYIVARISMMFNA